jgi:cell division protein FtsW
MSSVLTPVRELGLRGAKRGFNGARAGIRDLGIAILEPPARDDRGHILLPEEMRQDRIDWVLFASVVALFAFGLIMVFSSTSFVGAASQRDPYDRLIDQSIRGLIGLVLLFTLARLDYRRFSDWAPWIAIGSLLILVAVLVPGIGHESKGAQRWLGLGPIRIQPTEFARVGLTIYLARLLSKGPDKIGRFVSGPLPALVVGGAFMALIFLQKSLGCTIAVAATTICLCVLAGMRWKQFAIGAAAVLVLLIVAVVTMKLSGHDYQLARVEAWLAFWNGTDDPLGPTYQLRQSILALGSGEWLGVGIGDSQQKRYFLPDAHTDFIFSILGEEAGFLGAFAVLVAFALLSGRGLRIAAEAEDRFGYLLAAGLTINFAVYAAINLSVTMGLLPTTGLPLPFVSYGGSALIANLAAVGIILGISRRRGNYVLAPGRRKNRWYA